MAGEQSLPRSGVERAALAFSVLSSATADVVNRHLTIGERMLLREGLARTRDATDRQRYDAARALARDIRGGITWPRPSIHDDADCPFRIVLSHSFERAVDVLQRIAERDPLEVAVTLCHLPANERNDLWDAMSPEAHAAIVVALNEVHGVSTTLTRTYARDIAARLSRSMRTSRAAGLSR
jgi:hypothetical protein